MVHIVITGYIGPAETVQSVDLDPSLRVGQMYNTIKQFFNYQNEICISLVLTGDRGQCRTFFNFVTRCKPIWLSVRLHYYTQSSHELYRGKGWKEVQLLRNFIHNVDLGHAPFLKLSSKYTIDNLQQVLSLCNASTQSIGWTHLGKNMVDTRAMIITQSALESKHLLKVNDSLGYYLEHAMYDVLTETGKKLLFYKRPIISGLSGSTGSYAKMSVLKKGLIHTVTIATKGFRND